MGFVRQAGVAAILVAMTLWLQCAGMAILLRWVRASIARGTKWLNPWRSAVLMIRFTGVMIVWHILQILLWAGFYRWRCLPSWEPCFYFSATSYSTVGYGDVVLPQVWRMLERYRRPNVWPVRERPVCNRDATGHRRYQILSRGQGVSRVDHRCEAGLPNFLQECRLLRANLEPNTPHQQ